MLSYGALALSWILANTILVKRKFGSITKSEENNVSDVIYTTLKWGTTLLGAGIILGGVWADYSWGRFWGWDPKETWSLIVLCIYMAILHGRHTSWIRNERFITVTAGAFLSVLMAWFGVNYILATATLVRYSNGVLGIPIDENHNLLVTLLKQICEASGRHPR
jgi:ABC-type transport system involved in cytochrome c biogenesis permease subunit